MKLIKLIRPLLLWLTFVETSDGSNLVIFQQDDDSPFTLGEAVYFGSGCPEGTVASILSPGAEQLSIIFSDYIAMTEDNLLHIEKSCDLAIPVVVKPNVQLAIFKIEYRGFTFIPELDSNRKLTFVYQEPKDEGSIAQNRFLKKKKKKKKKKKGKKKKKKKGKKKKKKATDKPTPSPHSNERFASIHAEYFFAGIPGHVLEKKYTETDDPFFIEDDVNVVIFSGCGADTTLRISTSIVANKANEGEPDVEIGLDSAEVTNRSSSEIKYFIKASDCN